MFPSHKIIASILDRKSQRSFNVFFDSFVDQSVHSQCKAIYFCLLMPEPEQVEWLGWCAADEGC